MTNNDPQQECRICLQQSGNMEPLFELFFETFSLADILQNITSIKIEKHDNKPQSICLDCTTTLVKFNNLLTTFQDNEICFMENICKQEKDSSRVTTNEVEQNNPDSDNLAINSFYEDADDDKPSTGEKEKTDNFVETSRNTVNEKIETDPNCEKEEHLKEGMFSNKCESIECGECFLIKSSSSLHLTQKHNKSLKEEEYAEHCCTTFQDNEMYFMGNVSKKGRRDSSLVTNNEVQQKENEQNNQAVNLLNEDTEDKPSIGEMEKTDNTLEMFTNMEEIEVTKYSCSKCGDCFIHKYSFNLHMVRKHDSYLDNYQFDKYGSKITVKIPKAFPQVIKNKPTNLKCKICKIVTFPNREELNKHLEIHKVYKCDHCDMGFTRKYYLTSHVSIHSNDRQFACTLCNKSFKYRRALKSHKDSHTNIREFVCHTCGTAFTAQGTLRMHMKLKHSQEKNYPCPRCELSFKVKSWLDRHFTRKHSGIRKKDFICSKCGLSYFNKVSLQRHISHKHHSGNPLTYTCTICKKIYTLKKNLDKHIQLKHKYLEI